MSQPHRGWTVWTEEIPASVMLDMPPDLSKKIVNYLAALALEVGSAYDQERPLPGDPMDDLGVRYSLAIEGEPVVFEYTAYPETREIRIPILVWFH
ncbi:hypothetical protein ACFVY0_39355 [Streptomyces sp. NPDC058286]|uniref:hypothetical protein n=1 Tax=Streptomyces sp. NPDC058286 TaxID=3346422 RepID=UPI0036E9D4CF